MQLIAQKTMRYAHKPLVRGDRFEATPKDGRLLVIARAAIEVPSEPRRATSEFDGVLRASEQTEAATETERASPGAAKKRAKRAKQSSAQSADKRVYERRDLQAEE